ncbi:MAG: DMT family transporter [Tepidiformaceae bacterium]
MALLLALVSALSWGSADYLGGVQSRRLPPVAVALWSQVAGALVLLAILLLARESPTLQGVAWGVAAGVGTGAALAIFYRGLSGGAMAVVAPIAACAAAVPLAVRLFAGHPPSSVQFVGFALCLAGVATIALPQRDAAPGATGLRSAVLLGLAAALGFGLFYVFVDKGSGTGGSSLWVVGGVRVGAIATILALAGAGHSSLQITRPALPLLAFTGILDTGANVLFVIAATKGDLAVVSVLGSLYPIATVALATIISREPIAPLRGLGGAIALLGVAVLSAG